MNDRVRTFLGALDPERVDMVEHASFVARSAHGALGTADRLIAVAHILESVGDRMWRPDLNVDLIRALDTAAAELRDIAATPSP